MPAGIVFCSKTHALMGYQPDKRQITGIGGKAVGDETPVQTAFRETIEELFGIYPDRKIVDDIISSFSDYKATSNRSYKMFVLSLADLDMFLYYCCGIFKTTPYYEVFPITIEELILKRKTGKDVEVTSLALVPFVPYGTTLNIEDMEFIQICNNGNTV